MFWEGGQVPGAANGTGTWSVLCCCQRQCSEQMLAQHQGFHAFLGVRTPAVQVLINRTRSLYLYPVTGLSERTDKGDHWSFPVPQVHLVRKIKEWCSSRGPFAFRAVALLSLGETGAVRAGGAGRALWGRAWRWIRKPGCERKLKGFAGGLWARISRLQLQREYSLILNRAKRVCTGGKEEDKSHLSQLHL